MSKAAKRERQRLNREARREIEEREAKRRRRFKAIRNGLIVVVPIALVFTIFQVVRNDDDNGGSEDAITCEDVEASPAKDTTFPEPPPMTIDPTLQYVATLETSCGDIEVTLDAAAAPTTVNNFVFLAEQGFYDGLDFVRAAEDFVIQAGSPTQTNSGGPGYSVVGEVPPEGSMYEVGTVAMAKGGDEAAGTSGSQFFIITNPPATPGQGLEFLNTPPFQYALVGQVTAGLDIAQHIETFAPPEGDGPPTTVVVIRRVTITSGPPPVTTVATTAVVTEPTATAPGPATTVPVTTVAPPAS